MILITGNGVLAKELIKYSTKKMPIISFPKREMDITDFKQTYNVISKNNPKYVIHTAALTKPMSVNDRNPIMSIDTNIVGTANIAKICHELNIKLIYISTDYVYNNSIKREINEKDSLKPINNYGWSKLGGECAVHMISNYLILRCSLCDIPFRHEVAFDNIYRTPITHKDAAKLILKVKDETGIVNIGGPTKTVYDFVKEYQDITPITYKGDNPQIASIKLDTTKLKKIINE
jgi:dTDP-4-dehydrorhamnose reductase